MREREGERQKIIIPDSKLIVFDCTQSVVQLQTSFYGELHSVVQRLKQIYNWIRSNFSCSDKQLKLHFKSQKILLGDGERDKRLLSLRNKKQKRHYHNYKSFCTNSFLAPLSNLTSTLKSVFNYLVDIGNHYLY